MRVGDTDKVVSCLVYICVIYKKYYSPDINLLGFASALNPDSPIRMNCRYSPWFFMKFGLCFAEDAIFGYKYLITNFVIVVYTARIFPSRATIS